MKNTNKKTGVAEEAKKNKNVVMGRYVDRRGVLHIWNIPVLKEGVFPYVGSSVDPHNQLGLSDSSKIYAVFRSEKEIFSKETIESFRCLPVTDALDMKLGRPVTCVARRYKPLDAAVVKELGTFSKDDQILMRKRFGVNPKSKKAYEDECRAEQNQDCLKDCPTRSHIIGMAFNPHRLADHPKTLFMDAVIYDPVRYCFNVDMGVREIAACYFCSYYKEEGKTHDFLQKTLVGSCIAMVGESRNFPKVKLPKLTKKEQDEVSYIVPNYDVEAHHVHVEMDKEPRKDSPKSKAVKA